ncbi:MAG TPA: 4-alpha-glucanotransferase [Steroidobacteraceae bacterium]|nr:4-alpha-glucanotransferase [Steroidobacteraceae bacterium]
MKALPVLDRRRSGVLLHPTALIDEHAGHGALGRAARAFIDWLAAAGVSVWQVLPLGPVGLDLSPYWVRSDQAGNPALIDLREAPEAAQARGDYQDFCGAEQGWLEDYVLYAALSQAHEAAPWWTWPEPLRDRHPEALRDAAARLAPELERLRVEQWRFDRQWTAMREYARARGVVMYGDLPIYVAPDSVATWTERGQFQLTPGGEPAARAGVPPDYFAADGQLWGNPLYDWDQARQDRFAFWRARLASQLQRFDLVRIDHFRGLAGYWAVPATARTAREGEWRPAPGAELLRALKRACGSLPLVAEDLGIITPDVVALRRRFGLPGMRVLQFGFDGSPDNPHLPRNYTPNTVAYTGTHDNDTTLGWYRSLDAPTARRVAADLGVNAGEVPQAMQRAVLNSVAVLAVVPLQDVLGLGSEARFNTPGTVGGNWRWRVDPGTLTTAAAGASRTLNDSCGRIA